MTKYLISSTAFTGEIELLFNADNYLVFYHNRAEMDEKQFEFLFNSFPCTYAELVELTKLSKTLTVIKTFQHITFNQFWDAYGYKVGNKARAEKLWNALTNSDHVLIMDHLQKYDAYLAARPRMEKLYAETYLSQRRWESEFPKN